MVASWLGSFWGVAFCLGPLTFLGVGSLGCGLQPFLLCRFSGLNQIDRKKEGFSQETKRDKATVFPLFDRPFVSSLVGEMFFPPKKSRN